MKWMLLYGVLYQRVRLKLHLHSAISVDSTNTTEDIANRSIEPWDGNRQNREQLLGTLL